MQFNLFTMFNMYAAWDLYRVAQEEKYFLSENSPHGFADMPYKFSVLSSIEGNVFPRIHQMVKKATDAIAEWSDLPSRMSALCPDFWYHLLSSAFAGYFQNLLYRSVVDGKYRCVKSNAIVPIKSSMLKARPTWVMYKKRVLETSNEDASTQL